MYCRNIMCMIHGTPIFQCKYVIEVENTQNYTLNIPWKLLSWEFCSIKHDMKIHKNVIIFLQLRILHGFTVPPLPSVLADDTALPHHLCILQCGVYNVLIMSVLHHCIQLFPWRMAQSFKVCEAWTSYRKFNTLRLFCRGGFNLVME